MRAPGVCMIIKCFENTHIVAEKEKERKEKTGKVITPYLLRQLHGKTISCFIIGKSSSVMACSNKVESLSAGSIQRF